MKIKYFYFLIVPICGMIMTACSTSNDELERRALELCAYVPIPDDLERSRPYLTDDFFDLLDETFTQPSFGVMVHEWEFYFVAADGTPIANTNYSISEINQQDETHAIATISVVPAEPDYDIEKHVMCLQRVDQQWLISDFDNHKQDLINSLENSRAEQRVRNVIGDYLCETIGSQYMEAEICVPVVMIVAAEEQDSLNCSVLGDFWVFNYTLVGDTLKTISGGNHAGRMSLTLQDGQLVVKSFEQTVDGAGNVESAKRIFGDYFDIYQNIHSNIEVSEAARQEQLREFVRRNGVHASYYQDYGWQAVRLFGD